MDSPGDLSIAHLVRLVEESTDNFKMNNQSKSWYDYKGTSNSWNDGRRRHAARSSDSFRCSYDTQYHRDMKREMARKEGRRLRKAEQMEKESRVKAVDPQYNPSDQVCRFIPVARCPHCLGDHYGCPYQRDKIADSTGHLTIVPCPCQEHFLYSYGREND